LPLSPHWKWKIERWKRDWLGWLSAGEPEQARPKLCPSCGQLAGVNARRCPNCGASMKYSLGAASQSISRFLPATSPATYAILFFCCLLYGLCLLLTMRAGTAVGGGIMNFGGIGGRILLMFGASLPLQYISVEPWRLITAIFLHASLLHIGFNMWVLMDIGPMVEELYGSARYFFLFVLTGALGYVASAFMGHMSVGASGSLLGLIGLLLAVTTRQRSAGAQMLRGQLFRWLIYIGILGFVIPGVDNAAHVGGCVAGFLLGRVVMDRVPSGPAEQKRAQMLGWLTGAAVAISFVFMVLQLKQFG
jgi:rhomboid protease GluP